MHVGGTCNCKTSVFFLVFRNHSKLHYTGSMWLNWMTPFNFSSWGRVCFCLQTYVYAQYCGCELHVTPGHLTPSRTFHMQQLLSVELPSLQQNLHTRYTSTWQSGIVFINFVPEQNHLKYEICLQGNSLTEHNSHRINRFNYPHLHPQ